VFDEIEGVEPLVVDGKLKAQEPCIRTEAAHDAEGVAKAEGSVQRAMPLIIC
jgi:hypothetical protein